jgi:hypothetical protein
MGARDRREDPGMSRLHGNLGGESTMIEESDIDTYRDLRDYLNRLTDAQLDQPVQILPHQSDCDRPHELWPGFAIGTVGHFCASDPDDPPTCWTRSTFDNDHHPESVVILVDGNFFNEDGSIGEDLITGERVFPGTPVKSWTEEKS